ncbi:unnamed protein product, partial [Ixodes persulcatus]
VPSLVIHLYELFYYPSTCRCLADAFACAGFGNMAFSNLIGSNIFDILFCLGFPWLVKTLSHSSTGSLHINSGALTYTTLTLLATTVLMLVTLCASRWRLNWKVGIVCLVLYVAFIVLACCYELNFFGQFNPPTCVE